MKDTKMLFHPDFRKGSAMLNNNSSHYNTTREGDNQSKLEQQKEQGFTIRINTSFRDRAAWLENKGSLHKKDPYIDGQKIIGKIER